RVMASRNALSAAGSRTSIDSRTRPSMILLRPFSEYSSSDLHIVPVEHISALLSSSPFRVQDQPGNRQRQRQHSPIHAIRAVPSRVHWPSFLALAARQRELPGGAGERHLVSQIPAR